MLTLALSSVSLHAATSAASSAAIDVLPPVAAASAVAAPSSLASGLSPNLPLRRSTDAAWDGPGSSAVAVVALAILLALVAGWAFWRRGWAPPGMRLDGGLRSSQSTRLTARASVHVVQWDGRQWLVACTDHAVTVLGERPREPDAMGNGREGQKVTA